MRRLLVGAFVAGVALAALGTDTADAAAINVTLNPPAYGSSNTLTCGWHSLCDGIGPDSLLTGSDWISGSNLNAYVRASAQDPSSSSTIQVGVFKISQKVASPSSCDYVDVRIYNNSQSTLIGTVRLLHINSSLALGATSAIKGNSSFYNNSWRIGSMIGDAPAMCGGIHVMHKYIRGSDQYFEWYYGRLGCEVASSTIGYCYPACPSCPRPCNGCNKSYTVWGTPLFFTRYQR